MSEGKIFIVSGPSGCGKSTLLDRVFEERENAYFSISVTTRKPRAGERDGVDYCFVTKESFLNMIEEDDLLEYAEYVGNYYGTPRKPVEEKVKSGVDVFMDIEVQGTFQVKQKKPEAVSIFILPPSLEVLEERLRSRLTEEEEVIRKRLRKAELELEQADKYDYKIVNDSVERAFGELLSIIEKITGIKY